MPQINGGASPNSLTTFQWTISDYCTNSKITFEAINPRMYSSTFPMAQNPEIEWCLVLKLPEKIEKCHCCNQYHRQKIYRNCFNTWNEKTEISLYLENRKTDKNPVSLDVNFSILADNNRKVFTRNKIISGVLVESEEYGIDRFTLEKEIEKLMIDENLTILCEIKETSHLTITYPIVSEFSIHNTSFSDILLHVGEKKFFAHKIILASKSAFLKKNFLTKVEETEITELKISNTDPEIFIELLRFMYYGRVKNLQNLKREILKAAHLYQMCDLKKICEKSLSEDLTVENSVPTWKFADNYVATNLKKYCVNFILKNLEAVKKLKIFGDYLSHPELIYEILLAKE